jgi:perosamine synthetase
VQLAKLDAMNARRREIVEAYDRAFEGAPWMTRPVERSYARSACHNYAIKTPHRDALNLYLKDRGIATGVHYMPVHLQPYYRQQGRVSLPQAERVWTQLLTLPLYPGMTDDDVAYVTESVLSFEASAFERAAA